MIGIIGPGPVGLSLAALLQDRGLRPIVLHRQGGIDLKKRVNDRLYHFQEPSPEDEPPHIFFVAVKAYDVEGALRQNIDLLKMVHAVVLIGNGDIETIVKQLNFEFPEMNLRLGLTTIAAYENQAGLYQVNLKPRVVWGPISQNGTQHPTETNLISSNGNDLFFWQQNIFDSVRKKWLFNVAINCTTAAWALTLNGELLQKIPQLKKVFLEAFSLAQQKWPDWDCNCETVWDELLGLIRLTSQNQNSMISDINLKRKTEIDFFLGRENLKNFPLLLLLKTKIEEVSRKPRIQH